MNNFQQKFTGLWILIVLTAGISGCTPSPVDSTEVRSIDILPPTATPFQPLPTGTEATLEPNQTVPETQITAEPSLTPSANVEEKPNLQEGTLWVDPLLPAEVREAIAVPTGWKTIEKQKASLEITFGNGQRITDWFFTLVAPFPTITDNVSSEELKAFWSGSPSGKMSDRTLILSPSTQAALQAMWGLPVSNAIQVLAENSLLDTAWNNANTWAIVPFEQLVPRWKVLSIDEISPIHNDLNGLDYALRIPISIQGSAGRINSFLSDSAQNWDSATLSNRDPGKLTVLAMTGVTALVRATAYTMENMGITYPGEAIHDWLAGADLTHISNEVPFAENCPPPNPNQGNLIFCSDPSYIELLEYVGTDIVELTGDHFADWGAKAMYFTLDLYDEEGWLYYGGGHDLAEGKKPITIEHNGNRLAFIGCNGKGAAFASASATTPGAVVCDFPYMENEIMQLVKKGYLPIATFQHYEYYLYEAQPYQIRDFHLLADAGAVIVSGSQAHQPQAMEFFHGAFVHYGLGNLFFDQYLLGTAPRQGFIDRHVFYDNRYISTELLTIWFVDFAQPQPMSKDQRTDLLNTVFNASGW